MLVRIMKKLIKIEQKLDEIIALLKQNSKQSKAKKNGGK